MMVYDAVVDYAKDRFGSLYNYGLESAETVISSGRGTIAKCFRLVMGASVIAGLLTLTGIATSTSMLLEMATTHWNEVKGARGYYKFPLFLFKVLSSIVSKIKKSDFGFGTTVEKTRSNIRTALSSVKQLDLKSVDLEEVTMSGIHSSNQQLHDRLAALKEKGDEMIGGKKFNGLINYLEEMKEVLDEAEDLCDVQDEVIDGFYKRLNRVNAQWKHFRGESKQ